MQRTLGSHCSRTASASSRILSLSDPSSLVLYSLGRASTQQTLYRRRPCRTNAPCKTRRRYNINDRHELLGETLPASSSSTSTRSSTTAADPPLDQKLDEPTTPVSPNAPKRITIFVEPSPFTYVSGYKNRFTTMIKYLVAAGCEVLVVTTGVFLSVSAFRACISCASLELQKRGVRCRNLSISDHIPEGQAVALPPTCGTVFEQPLSVASTCRSHTSMYPCDDSGQASCPRLHCSMYIKGLASTHLLTS